MIWLQCVECERYLQSHVLVLILTQVDECKTTFADQLTFFKVIHEYPRATVTRHSDIRTETSQFKLLTSEIIQRKSAVVLVAVCGTSF